MNKTVYIHIGFHKTGTSFLQRYCTMNTPALARLGLLYPRVHFSDGHHHLLVHDENWLKHHDKALLEREWSGVAREISASPCPKALLSSEEFSSMNAEEIAFALGCLKDFDCKVIVYVRRIDTHIQSRFAEQLKVGIVMETFEDFCRNYREDALEVISRWADAVGDANVIVRPFERESFGPAIERDFLACMGVTPNEECQKPEAPLRVSPDRHIVAFWELCASLQQSGFYERGDMVNVITDARYSQVLADAKPLNDYPLLSPARRRELVEQNAAQYEAIARRFLPGSDGVLFRAPLPNPDDPYTPYEGLSATALAQIVIGMQVQANRRLERLDRKRTVRALRRAWKKFWMKVRGRKL